MEIGAQEVWNLSSWADDGHCYPLPPGRRPRQRGAGQPQSGRGIEWQGWREGPQGKHIRELASPVAQAFGARAESVDEGSVLGAEFEFGSFVRCVDKGCRAAVGGGGTAVGILGQDGSDAHGLSTFGFVFGLGGSLDLFDDTAAFGLALVCR
jgi:hypothetical protein